MTHGTTPPTPVAAWWQRRLGASFVDRLRLDQRRLIGGTITSQTTHSLQLARSRFDPISSVSADGHSFPTDPEEFRREVLHQAAELYSGRSGLRMDLPRLQHGVALGHFPTADSPDFETVLADLLHPVPQATPLSAHCTQGPTLLGCLLFPLCFLSATPPLCLNHAVCCWLGAIDH